MSSLHISSLLAGAVAAIVAGAFALPAAADSIPSYAIGSTDESIHGTVASVSGPNAITVRDARGFIDNVTLHRGTVINPTGLMLEPGQSVTILGQARGHTFSANEIDTPYRTVAVGPIYPGYGYGYGFGNPYGRGSYPFYGAAFGFHRGFGIGFGI